MQKQITESIRINSNHKWIPAKPDDKSDYRDEGKYEKPVEVEKMLKKIKFKWFQLINSKTHRGTVYNMKRPFEIVEDVQKFVIEPPCSAEKEGWEDESKSHIRSRVDPRILDLKEKNRL